uniref:Uncharacterized protein n=1 Tax=Clytia hemisphaerica TaxID=252671 RepID=A0A7M5X9C8_9CNID
MDCMKHCWNGWVCAFGFVFIIVGGVFLIIGNGEISNKYRTYKYMINPECIDDHSITCQYRTPDHIKEDKRREITIGLILLVIGSIIAVVDISSCVLQCLNGNTSSSGDSEVEYQDPLTQTSSVREEESNNRRLSGDYELNLIFPDRSDQQHNSVSPNHPMTVNLPQSKSNHSPGYPVRSSNENQGQLLSDAPPSYFEVMQSGSSTSRP